MSSDVVATPVRNWQQTLRVCGAWVLMAGCLLLVGAILVAGERATSYDDLSAAVERGDVDEVRISGGLSEAGVGFSLTEVHWRSGVIARVTEVVETTSRSEASEADPDAPVIVGHVDDRLTRLDPGLRTTRAGEITHYYDLSSWRVPSWCGPVGIVVVLAALVLLVLGPQPRRATKWAWFWLLGAAPPLGILAFLLFGGSTGRWPPAESSRRLTGGWSFLLVAALSLLGSAVL